MARAIRRRSWGESLSVLLRPKLSWWIDLLLLAGVVGIFCGLFSIAGEATQHLRPKVDINLSPWALPKYTFYSLSRGMIAYALSLVFTLLYGYWAAKDRVAERLLVPVLDILQSIPLLGFLPGVVVVLVGLFPSSNFGLELASVLFFFLGQVWNMTFSFYHSLRTIPDDMLEVSRVYRFNAWRRFRWVELPFSTIGLLWNSMMSMAGGWFFLTASEAFQLGDKDYRLPGLGAYMSVAVNDGNWLAMIYAIIAMIVMIALLDQLFWRPITVWAQKFRIEETGQVEEMHSWFLTMLHKSGALGWASEKIDALWARIRARGEAMVAPRLAIAGGGVVGAGGAWGRARRRPALRQRRSVKLIGPRSVSAASAGAIWFSRVMVGLVTVAIGYGIFQLVNLMKVVTLAEWGLTVLASFATLGRVLAATLAGTIIAVPAGLAIGLSPRLSRVLQPVVQIIASFPAPMLYPAMIAVMLVMRVTLNWGSIFLMLLGTQWYVLFNVIAGAMAVPADLREMSRSYRFTRLQRFKNLYLPGIFPFLVTGWVTAAGGAWNASIVAEYMVYKDKKLTAFGLGSIISQAVEDKHYALLAAAVTVMAVMVVAFNMVVWRRLYDLSEKRYTLNK